MKKRNYLSFFSGMVTALALSACVTSALAAADMVEFNVVNLSFNSKQVLTQGETIEASNGARVPSSILYTDEQGGGTTYLPVRYLFETLGMPVEWDGAENMVEVDVEGDYALNLLGTKRSSHTKFQAFTEIDAVQPDSGKELLKTKTYQNDAGEAYEAIVVPRKRKGNLISITVTNHDPSKAVQFDLGANANDTYIKLPVRVPAGESVTRTVEITDFGALDYCPVYISVSCPDDIRRALDLEISAVQFDK